jgi:hypothetical protein
MPKMLRMYCLQHPTTSELLRFGPEIRGVNRPEHVLRRTAEAMAGTLREYAGGLGRRDDAWSSGLIAKAAWMERSLKHR